MISIDLGGRLGNQLFQYAMIRTIAERRGFNFILDYQGWIGAGIFNVYLGKSDGIIQRIYEEHGSEFNPEVFDVDDFTSFHGYFQNEKYFDHAKTRQWFKIDPTEEAIAILNSHPIEDYCYIHFRGGDYNVYPWNMYQLPNSYYEQGMNIMREYNPNMKFVFVTDDRQKVREKFPDAEIISEDTKTDFTTLMCAKYTIISNSSFSWWTAWLNPNNVVIAPEGWFYYNINKGGAYQPNGIYVERFRWI